MDILAASDNPIVYTISTYDSEMPAMAERRLLWVLVGQTQEVT